MRGTDARGIIAAMADVAAWRDDSVGQHPSHAMRAAGNARGNAELTIATTEPATPPFPTLA